MKRWIGPLSLLALIAALAVVGTAGASHRVTSPVKGSFKYCSDPTFPPMESTTTSGQPVGFDIDLAAAIAKLWKVKAKFVQTAFPGLLPALDSHKCNAVISGIFVTPDRPKGREGTLQKKQPPGRVAMGYLSPETDPFGINSRKSPTKLGTALRTAIKTLKKTGTMKRRAAKRQIPAADVK